MVLVSYYVPCGTHELPMYTVVIVSYSFTLWYPGVTFVPCGIRELPTYLVVPLWYLCLSFCPLGRVLVSTSIRLTSRSCTVVLRTLDLPFQNVKHLPLELFQKRNGYGLNACNNVRDTLYNTDIINSFVKLIVHSPVGKLV